MAHSRIQSRAAQWAALLAAAPAHADEALKFGDLALASCPRATLNAPPKPFHF